MTLTVIHAARVPPEAWRNGGGRTRCLLAWPDAADWWLRVSLAEIDADAVFSPYPGVQRWFQVVQGHGVLLAWSDHRRLCTTGDPPLAFDGGAPPRAELVDGRTRDLNLMLVQHRVLGRLEALQPGAELLGAAPLRGVFSLDRATLQVEDRDAARLDGECLAWSAHAARQRWRLVAGDGQPPPRAWWFEATPREAAA